MKYKFFTIPAINPEQAETLLNRFCEKHHILQVDRQLIDSGANSFWAICVCWSDNEGSLAANAPKKSSVDYRELLNADDFAAYAKLRELRKKVAEREGTAVYNIFTNEQLAKMVTNKVANRSAMSEIKGIGQAKMEKYAADFLACLNDALVRRSNEAP